MRLFRISNLCSLLVATILGVLLFWTSQDVQLKEDELSGLKKSLHHETETIRVLSVEWDYLNRPQRLEQLAADQLGMIAPSVSEVVSGIHEIPEPVVPLVKPQLFDEGIAQSVSLVPEQPKAVAAAKPETTVSPSSAEKQNFDKLIQSLDEEGGQ